MLGAIFCGTFQWKPLSLLSFSPDSISFSLAFFLSTDRDALPQWDTQIESLCLAMNEVVDEIESLHPELMNEALVHQQSRASARAAAE